MLIKPKTNHYTYIIRHINGRYYVGRRSTKKDPLLDPYMGSGNWVNGIKDRSTLTKTIIAYYDTFEELKVAEFELIEKYFDDEYCMNVLYGSGGAASGDKHHMYGRTHTEEARKKISDATIGENNPMYGMTGDKHPMYGRTHTEETKQLMSAAQSGDKNSFYGQIHTEETKQLMSDAQSGENNPMYGKTGELSYWFGKQHNENSKQKMAKSKIGIERSVETKKKISESRTGIKLSTKTKQKLSESKRGEKSYRATIAEVVVKLIKIRIAEGLKNKPIADEYNTTVNVVQGIRSGRNWKHVTI